MKLGVLFSGGASATPYMEDITVGISSSKNASGLTKLKKRGVPIVTLDIHEFYKERGKPTRDWETRKEWDRGLIERLDRYQVDIVACSGYMYILTPELINKYSVLNVHPADLRILDSEDNRKYIGANAVFDALRAGERETRSTVHLMDEKTDHGPILVVSPPLPVDSDLLDLVHKDILTLQQAAGIHQHYMKYYCDGPAYRTALNLLAEDRLEMYPDIIWLDGEPLENGYVMTESDL